MFDLSYMRLHAYLEEIVGSKTAISLIRTLLTRRGEVFTIRKLAQTAGVSPSEASIVVRQLEEAGVLTLKPVGRSFLVTPNEQSFVLRRIMEPIVHAERETLNELIKLLKTCFEHNRIHSAYLFGSVARHEEKKDSDIDLLVISNDYDQAISAVSRASEKVAISFNKEISPLVFSEREFASKKKSDLVNSIRSNYVFVAGKEDLLR